MEPKTSKAEKVLQLTVELAQTIADKKDTTKAYNEEIKRIQAEIKSLISKDEVIKVD